MYIRLAVGVNAWTGAAIRKSLDTISTIVVGEILDGCGDLRDWRDPVDEVGLGG